MNNKENQSKTGAEQSAEFLNYKEVAQLLRVSKRTVVNMVAAGELPFIKLRKRIIFHKPTLERIILERQRPFFGLNKVS